MASTVSNGNDRSEKWHRPFQMATTVYEREICVGYPQSSLRTREKVVMCKKKRVYCQPRVFKHDNTRLSFLNGFKIFDTDQLILALIFRFGAILI